MDALGLSKICNLNAADLPAAMIFVILSIMKTKPYFILPVMAAVLIANFTGCDSPGPLTRAASLSSLKTFSMVGLLDKNGTQPIGDAPAETAAAQAVREVAESKGYQYQSEPSTADFLVVVSWIPHQELVPSSQPGPTAVPIELDDISIHVVRDRATKEILWSNPASEPVALGGITNEGVKGIVLRAMRDFPPSQPTR